ncbi:MAG: hypothetical protein JSV10_05860 [Candidatus Zixiibacteriota bacterium]|nr:MAG: hypothetical protein JSV10_05860 [candidate division Zixibacteria bacterium]
MKRNVSVTVFLFVMLLAVAPMATADVPNQIYYQGQLTDALGAPLDTIVSMTFAIYIDSSAGSPYVWTETQTGVEVSGGLFSVLLGSVTPIDETAFTDDWRWLGITIGSDPEIRPLTKLVTVPYAFRVATVDGSTGGVISGDVDIQSDLTVSGKATIGPGHTNTGTYSFVAGQTNTVDNWGSTVGGGSSNAASQMYSTVSGGGTNTASGEYSAIGGGALNAAVGHYSTVGGGRGDTTWADYATIGGGASNSVDSAYATVAGGAENRARGHRSTVGGGSSNFAGGWRSTVAGGAFNATGATQATVGGGQSNFAGGINATVGGGYVDSAKASGTTVSGGNFNTAEDAYSTVSGGHFNIASGYESTVSGGYYDTASGHGSTVCGGRHHRADGTYSAVGGGQGNKANGDGSVICGGSNSVNDGLYSAIPGGSADTIGSDADYSMVFGSHVLVNNPYRVILFTGGLSGRVGINRDDHDSGGVAYPLQVGNSTSNGNGAYVSEGGTWQNGSSRSFKEAFQPLDAQELLAKISKLPVEAWRYRGTQERHIGPVSEDFVRAFDVGTVENGRRDDKYLSPGDVAGVALAGVKELVQKNEQLMQQNQELKAMLEELKRRINKLEQSK